MLSLSLLSLVLLAATPAALLSARPANAQDPDTGAQPETRADPDAASVSLELIVTGLRGGTGTLYIGLYDSPDGFPERNAQIRQARVSVKGDRVVATVPDVPPGRYAVAAFHDQNNNGQFDTGMFGMPLEGFGFTRNPTVIFGAPAFEEAAFVIEPPKARLTFRMRYAL